MISPHPPRLRMKRRKTVSVTPAIGARTVAGAIRTEPNWTESGTRVFPRMAGEARAPQGTELSQNFFTCLFYLPGSGELRIEVGQRLFQHAAMLRIAGHLQLLQDSLAGKFQATTRLFGGDLLRRKLLA